MADTAAQAEIRGINIDKLAKGFADEQNILKRFVVNSKTKAREIRWYQKTSGFLDSSDTTDITKSHIANTSSKSLPVVVEQSWTRQTSYVKKYFVESPLFTLEDIKDSDVDIMATHVRDLVRAVERKVDLQIFAILTDALAATPTQPLTNGEVTVQNTAATDEWDVAATADPIADILNGKQLIRAAGYNPEGSMIGMNSIEHKELIQYLINVKGSSIPQFASDKVKSGIVMEILGCNVVVSEAFTTDWVVQWVPSRALTWKAFTPITTAIMDEPGIGKKIRVWEEGEALLTDPKAVHVISNTNT